LGRLFRVFVPAKEKGRAFSAAFFPNQNSQRARLHPVQIPEDVTYDIFALDAFRGQSFVGHCLKSLDFTDAGIRFHDLAHTASQAI
jgi:hypothetical protein